MQFLKLDSKCKIQDFHLLGAMILKNIIIIIIARFNINTKLILNKPLDYHFFYEFMNLSANTIFHRFAC